MKQHMKILLLLWLLITAITSHAASIDRVVLWGNTYYGMSLKEVQLAFPTVQIKPDNTGTLNLKSNDRVLAKLDMLEIAGRNFNVWFIFNNDQLSHVTLTLAPNVNPIAELSTGEEINKLYEHYAELLTAKYGNPINKTWQEYAPLNIRLWNTQWIKGLTNVELNVDKTQLKIIYGAEYAEDLKKL